MSVKVHLDLKNLLRIKKSVAGIKDPKVKIGIEEGATYESGTKISDVAAYLEYGWTQKVSNEKSGWFTSQGVYVPPGSTLTSPPRPFFELTREQNRNKWVKLGKHALKGYTKVNPKTAAKQALALVGQVAQQDLQDMVQDGGSNFEQRSELTMRLYTAQLEGHKTDGTPNNMQTRKPLNKVGHLASAIVYEIEGLE